MDEENGQSSIQNKGDEIIQKDENVQVDEVNQSNEK